MISGNVADWGLKAKHRFIGDPDYAILLSDEDAKSAIICKPQPSSEARSRKGTRSQTPAEDRRGKKRPKHVIEALRAANLGRKLLEEHRAKMSEAHKRRGTIPPKSEGQLWAAEEDELVRTLTAAEVAEQTGRTLSAIDMRRNKLGMPDARRG